MRKIIFAICCLLFVVCFFSLPSSTTAKDIYTTEKLITVDLYQQKLFVWEGGKLINQSRVSTGLWRTPTPKGSFRVYWKRLSQTMKGGSIYYGNYNYPNVPNVMYFYHDYAIHGAYWHNSFGYRASHGCVNLPVAFSKWLYDFAPVGTRVEIF